MAPFILLGQLDILSPLVMSGTLLASRGGLLNWAVRWRFFVVALGEWDNFCDWWGDSVTASAPNNPAGLVTAAFQPAGYTHAELGNEGYVRKD
jgi:hypothetical protein